ncbi:hypothetical protein pb186bvf_006251 [Paramecium bursaria]
MKFNKHFKGELFQISAYRIINYFQLVQMRMLTQSENIIHSIKDQESQLIQDDFIWLYVRNDFRDKDKKLK